MFKIGLIIGMLMTAPCADRACVISDIDYQTDEVCVVDVADNESAYFDDDVYSLHVGQDVIVTFDVFGRIVDAEVR